MDLNDSVRRRFDAKVDRSGGPDACWPWTGTITQGGYGQLAITEPDGTRLSVIASRVAWEIAHGPIPDGMQVCHRCDRRPCCNDTHLFLGTSAENQHDKRNKGRAAKGENNKGGGKLTEHDVRAIRELLTQGQTMTAIGAQFGVSRVQISHIRSGKHWSHVL